MTKIENTDPYIGALKEESDIIIKHIKMINKCWEDFNKLHPNYVIELVGKGGDLHVKFYQYVKKLSDACQNNSNTLSDLLEEFEITHAIKKFDKTSIREIKKSAMILMETSKQFELEGNDFLTSINEIKENQIAKKEHKEPSLDKNLLDRELSKKECEKELLDKSLLVKYGEERINKKPFEEDMYKKVAIKKVTNNEQEPNKIYAFGKSIIGCLLAEPNTPRIPPPPRSIQSYNSILDALSVQMNSLQDHSKVFSDLIDIAADQIVTYINNVVAALDQSKGTVYGDTFEAQTEVMIDMAKQVKLYFDNIEVEASKNKTITNVFLRKNLKSFRP